jgi:hypothetical protein
MYVISEAQAYLKIKDIGYCKIQERVAGDTIGATTLRI